MQPIVYRPGQMHSPVAAGLKPCPTEAFLTALCGGAALQGCEAGLKALPHRGLPNRPLRWRSPSGLRGRAIVYRPGQMHSAVAQPFRAARHG